nr:SDR family NAD(P)-dependent oxidoreductase [Nitrospirales bacterium]
MATKILVTGGAGFIGSHLVDRLIQEGNEVVVVDNLSTGKRKHINKKAVFYKLDIQSKRIDKVLRNERPLVVVHLAAQMNVRHSTEDPQFDAQVNILGTINLLEHAVRHGVRKVTFASSGGAVYGEQEVFPAPENHRTEPLSPYGISKLAGEKYLAYYAN